MIKITIFKNNGRYTGFTSIGHAEYAEHGSDIVCAAVSALVINTINSIEAFSNDHIKLEVDEEEGKILCNFTEIINEKTTLLMDSLILGLKNVQSDYNNEYVKLIFKEV